MLELLLALLSKYLLVYLIPILKFILDFLTPVLIATLEKIIPDLITKHWKWGHKRKHHFIKKLKNYRRRK